MKMPGKAWLQWELQPQDQGARLIQTAYFDPNGLPGILYWYSLYSVHRVIFGRLVKTVGG
jgi:hypothetical protein